MLLKSAVFNFSFFIFFLSLMAYLTRCCILVTYVYQLGGVCENWDVDDLKQTGSLAEPSFLVLLLF